MSKEGLPYSKCEGGTTILSGQSSRKNPSYLIHSIPTTIKQTAPLSPQIYILKWWPCYDYNCEWFIWMEVVFRTVVWIIIIIINNYILNTAKYWGGCVPPNVGITAFPDTLCSSPNSSCLRPSSSSWKLCRGTVRSSAPRTSTLRRAWSSTTTPRYGDIYRGFSEEEADEKLYINMRRNNL